MNFLHMSTKTVLTLDIIPWVSTYDPRQPDIRQVVQDDNILKTSHRMSKVVEKNRVIIAQRRSATIGNILKMNKLRFTDTCPEKWGCKPCGRPRCKSCETMTTTSTIKNRDSKTFYIKHTLNCQSNFVVYCITCNKCQIQYVGQTINSFSTRLSGHRHNIKFNKTAKAPHVAPHFNISGHSLSCTLLQRVAVQDQAKLNLAESIWIHRLNCVWPMGLNEHDPSGR